MHASRAAGIRMKCLATLIVLRRTKSHRPGEDAGTEGSSMQSRTPCVRVIARIVCGLSLVAPAVTTSATLAQAYSPDPDVWAHYRNTSDCPCSGGSLGDPFDGTYFKRDAGGRAVKIEMVHSSRFVGKIEFHPYDEQLWLYDTRNDGDTFYVEIQVAYDGYHTFFDRYRVRGTSKVVDKRVVDLSLREGSDVAVRVYDASSYTDLITRNYAIT